MAGAFQSSAFQNSAFQIDGVVPPAVGGNPMFGGTRYQSNKRLYRVNGQTLALSDRELRDFLEYMAEDEPKRKKKRPSPQVEEVIEYIESDAPDLLQADPLLRLQAYNSLRANFDDQGRSQMFVSRLMAQIKRQIELEIDDEEVILLLMH